MRRTTTKKRVQGLPALIETNFNSIYELISEVENNSEKYTGAKFTYNSLLGGNREEFFGAKNWDAAKELLNNYVNEAQKELLTLSNNTTNLFNLVPSVSGQFNDVTAYIQGVPECMVDFEQIQINQFKDIVINVTEHAGISAETIQGKATEVFKSVYSNEANGTRCRIFAELKTFDDEGNQMVITRVKIKEFNEPLNGSLHSYLLGNGSFMRCFLLVYASLISKKTTVGPVKETEPQEGKIVINYSGNTPAEIYKKLIN
jgi:hypothetical protein